MFPGQEYLLRKVEPTRDVPGSPFPSHVTFQGGSTGISRIPSPALLGSGENQSLELLSPLFPSLLNSFLCLALLCPMAKSSLVHQCSWWRKSLSLGFTGILEFCSKVSGRAATGGWGCVCRGVCWCFGLFSRCFGIFPILHRLGMGWGCVCRGFCWCLRLFSRYFRNILKIFHILQRLGMLPVPWLGFGMCWDEPHFPAGISPISHLDLPFPTLKPFPLFLPLHILVPPSPGSPFGHWKMLQAPPGSSLSRLGNPSSSSRGSFSAPGAPSSRTRGMSEDIPDTEPGELPCCVWGSFHPHPADFGFLGTSMHLRAGGAHPSPWKWVRKRLQLRVWFFLYSP